MAASPRSVKYHVGNHRIWVSFVFYWRVYRFVDTMLDRIGIGGYIHNLWNMPYHISSDT